KIPAPFKKTEAPPPHQPTLTPPRIHTPIPPLFPKPYTHHLQIINILLTPDPHSSPQITLKYPNLLHHTKTNPFESVIHQPPFTFDVDGKI
ncbi:exosome complex component, partial [Staphylococcus epidermidis]|uniref:hypothetical protein n=1 Tax=Staphylococcus epidermidis TaxID=1282 RepID=UPI001C92D5F0